VSPRRWRITPNPDVGRAARASRWLPLAGIALFNLLVWGRTIGFGFVFDDLVNVSANVWIRSWQALPAAFTHHAAGFDARFDTSFYRPFMHVFYAAAYALAGPQPWAYHLLNVVLQTACAIGVYVFSDQLCRRWSCRERYPALPLLAALLFSVHPVHAEAVAWIAGVTDLSYASFAFLALIAYVREFDRGVGVWPGLWLLASLLSKETGAVVLPLMLVLEWLESGRDHAWTVRAALRRLAVPAACAGIYLILRFAALGSLVPSASHHPHTTANLLAAGAGLFARYLGVLVWPADLTVLRSIPLDRGVSDPATIVGLLLAVALGALAVRARQAPLIRLSVALIVLPILPALYVPAIESGWSVFGERYLYLPVLGLAWCIAVVAAELARGSGRRRAASLALVGVLLCWYAAASLARERVWASSLELWTDEVRTSPDSAAAQEGLCFALYGARRMSEALSACDRALALDPTRADARINRANVLLALGRPSEALSELDIAIGLRFDSAAAHTARGLACMALGRAGDGLAAYRQALAIDPGFAEAHNDLGVALVHAGQPAAARPHFEEAVRLAPDDAEYRSNLLACPR
jgi:protein O-mannosyl-transferase